jgi:hypothetical protein
MISEKDIEDWLHFELKEVTKEIDNNYWKFSASLGTDKDLLNNYQSSVNRLKRILERLNGNNSN